MFLQVEFQCEVFIWCDYRLEKLAKEFYLCVQAKDIAQTLQLDEDTVDFIYNYWMLKRRVGGATLHSLVTWQNLITNTSS